LRLIVGDKEVQSITTHPPTVTSFAAT
jgi:hypothetical protein